MTDDSPHPAAAAVAAAALVDVCDEGQGEAGAAPVLDLAGDEGSLEDEEFQEDEEPVEVEKGIVCPRRAVVTPLRVLLFLGAPEVSNRILRKYGRPQRSAAAASVPRDC